MKSSFLGGCLFAGVALCAMTQAFAADPISAASAEPLTEPHPCSAQLFPKPVFSSDGRSLYFESETEKGATRIYRLDLASKQVVPVAHFSDPHTKLLASCPDGKLSVAMTGDSRIRVADIDGSGVSSLVVDSPGRLTHLDTPAREPGCGDIVAFGAVDNGTHIYVTPVTVQSVRAGGVGSFVDRREARQVAAGRRPAIAPKGDLIAFFGDSNIVVRSLQSKTSAQRIVRMEEEEIFGGVEFSPDASHIVFGRARRRFAAFNQWVGKPSYIPGPWQLWVAGVDGGSAPYPILSSSADGEPRAIGEALAPVWHPAGDRLVFTLREGRTCKLVMVSLHGPAIEAMRTDLAASMTPSRVASPRASCGGARPSDPVGHRGGTWGGGPELLARSQLPCAPALVPMFASFASPFSRVASMGSRAGTHLRRTSEAPSKPSTASRFPICSTMSQ